MLSILIPCYNYNLVPLVKELHNQVMSCAIDFEILAYDDASKHNYNIENKTINSLKNCTFKELPNNIGRSRIRNKLGLDAKYNTLLFIDAGTFPQKKDFIKNYLVLKDKPVVNGGMALLKNPPKPPFKLRWLYTKKRETKKGLHSCNFMIKKKSFINNLFDESIIKYGYEDVLFFDTLKKNNCPVYVFNNPVLHQADDDANTFIKKNENAIENLVDLINYKKIHKDRVRISKYFYFLKPFRLNKIVLFSFKVFKPLLLLNFNSSRPSLILFDFYRLGYFCSIKNKE